MKFQVYSLCIYLLDKYVTKKGYMQPAECYAIKTFEFKQ